MCQLEKIKDFINDSKTYSERDLLHKYLEFARELMFCEKEEVVLDCIEVLKNNIEKWALEKSLVYKNFQKDIIIEKHMLEHKENWYVDSIVGECARTSTNGSTTGNPFEYLRWEVVYNKIEFENHYDLIMDEFEIKSNPNVLYFFPNHYQFHGDSFIFKTVFSGNGVVDHGSKRRGFIHYVNFEKFKSNQDEFFEYLFDYIKQNEIDVFYTSGPRINQLCHQIKKNNVNHKISNLLSNTNERFLPEDANFLLSGGFFENVCDHMRCWDGGASFFTCKYNNYHIMDNLSWCEEVNEKLISTDYFSLGCPFIRYWNGDYCKLDNEYKRCECGRLYRDFEFLENRPFSIKGTCLKDIKDKMNLLNIEGIKQARCSVNFIDVVTSRNLTEEEKENIRKLTDKFDFKFIVED